MATGANRGAWYAGFMGPLRDAGIEFELLAGVSAGGIASAWFAAGDEEALIDSWRQADPYRIALHPLFSIGRRRTVDQLIRNITLKTMDLEAARTSAVEVRMAAAKIVGPGIRASRRPLDHGLADAGADHRDRTARHDRGPRRGVGLLWRRGPRRTFARSRVGARWMTVRAC
jgi:hypothetical protein